jgi:hypothetical protein
MRRIHAAVVAALLVGLAVAHVHASGQAGVYGVIEKIIVEPATGPAERVQLWGAFALMETMGRGFTGYVYKQPERGYMYFKLPARSADIENARREWKDLASVAATMQAVAFGHWDRNRGDAFITVRSATVAPANPDVYFTDMGITKLNSSGNRTVEALLKLAAAR